MRRKGFCFFFLVHRFTMLFGGSYIGYVYLVWESTDFNDRATQNRGQTFDHPDGVWAEERCTFLGAFLGMFRKRSSSTIGRTDVRQAWRVLRISTDKCRQMAVNFGQKHIHEQAFNETVPLYWIISKTAELELDGTERRFLGCRHGLNQS